MTRIIAHRGFSGKYPENTLLAIKKALDIGVDWVEIDVWITMEDNVIMIHDPTLKRTTNGKGRVFWKTMREIKKYHTKKGNQSIPILEEVFPLIKRGTMLNIELKHMWAARPVANLIEKYNMHNKVLISSGSINALKIMKYTIPSIKTAYIYYTSKHGKWDYFVTSIAKLFSRITHKYILMVAKALRVDYVHLSYPFATTGFIKKLHKEGYKVNIWTVNTSALMKKLIKRKVDGIITNYPDKLKRVIKEIEKNSKKKSKKKK